MTARPWSDSLAAGQTVGDLRRDALFEQILREEGAALRRVAASYERDRSLQQDLFQEICLAVWTALPSFRGEASLRTFVFRIAHNRATSHALRRSRLRETGLEQADAGPPLPGSQPRAPDVDWRAERLREGMARLPLPARQVLMLALEGLTHREIGEVLGLGEGNVAVRLSRARSSLRRLLGDKSDGGD